MAWSSCGSPVHEGRIVYERISGKEIQRRVVSGGNFSRRVLTFTGLPPFSIPVEDVGAEKDVWMLAHVDAPTTVSTDGTKSVEFLPTETFQYLQVGSGFGENTNTTLSIGSDSASAPLTVSIAGVFSSPKDKSREELIHGLLNRYDRRSQFLGGAVVLLGVALAIGTLASPVAVVLAQVTVTASLCLAIIGLFVPGYVRDVGFGVNVSDEVRSFKHPPGPFSTFANWLVTEVPGPVSTSNFPETPANGSLSIKVLKVDGMVSTELPSHEIFGGILTELQEIGRPALANIAWGFIALLLGAALLSGIGLWEMAVPVALTAGIFTSIAAALYFSTGTDGVFFNLRHAQLFAEHGVYSYNLKELQEGTVNFLPVFFTGILAQLGMPLMDAALLISLSGNILTIIAAFLIARSLCSSPVAAAVIAALIGVFPSLILVGGSGYAASVVTGFSLLAAYFTFFGGKRGRLVGVALFGLLTLIRVETIFLTIFVYLWFFLVRRGSEIFEPFYRRRYLIDLSIWTAILFAPFIVSCAVRWWIFGYPFPAPLFYKNTTGDIAYAITGLDQLKETILIFHIDQVLIAFLLTVPLLIAARKIEWSVLGALVTFGLFSLGYFLIGGDSLPIEWSRFGMSFNVLLYLITAAGVVAASRLWFVEFWPIGVFAAAVVMIGAVLNSARPGSAFSRGTIVRNIDQAGRWDSIDAAFSFGRFIQTVTKSDAVIATSDSQAAGFVSQRELLDLSGFVNLGIGRMPLNPLTPGHLVFRKRDPNVIVSASPTVIVFPGFAQRLRGDEPELTLEQVGDVIHSKVLDKANVESAFYRAGSFQDLLDLGYKPVAVLFRNMLFTYWVKESELSIHDNLIQRLNPSTFGTVDVPYEIPSWLVGRFGL